MAYHYLHINGVFGPAVPTDPLPRCFISDYSSHQRCQKGYSCVGFSIRIFSSGGGGGYQPSLSHFFLNLGWLTNCGAAVKATPSFHSFLQPAFIFFLPAGGGGVYDWDCGTGLEFLQRGIIPKTPLPLLPPSSPRDWGLVGPADRDRSKARAPAPPPSPPPFGPTLPSPRVSSSSAAGSSPPGCSRAPDICVGPLRGMLRNHL